LVELKKVIEEFAKDSNGFSRTNNSNATLYPFAPKGKIGHQDSSKIRRVKKAVPSIFHKDFRDSYGG